MEEPVELSLLRGSNFFYPSNNFAIPNAAAAATAPISITRIAPHQGLIPVRRLF